MSDWKRRPRGGAPEEKNRSSYRRGKKGGVRQKRQSLGSNQAQANQEGKVLEKQTIEEEKKEKRSVGNPGLGKD